MHTLTFKSFLPVVFLHTHTYVQGLFRLCVCVCAICREKMPFHHVRAGLLYPDNYLSSSLTEGSEAFQLTSISTEELGGECAGIEGGGWEVGGWWGCRVKCEVLAINVSLQEQCSYNAPILPGKSFSIYSFCQSLTGCIGFQLSGNKISHRTSEV